MANRGKRQERKPLPPENPATVEPEKGGTETNEWEPGFPNWDII